MCRLAARLGPAIHLEDLICSPTHSLINQSQAAIESKFAVNGDGYGFSWYADDGRLGVYKNILPAWGDSNLTNLAAMIRSPLILAHVRASTFGENSRSNCHPFVSGRWSFMHNGQIADFGQHRRKLEQHLSDELYAQRTGNTDSELLFLLLLSYGLDNNVRDACHSVLELVSHTTADCLKATRITAVFSDGKYLYALRTSTDNKSPTLYVKRNSNDTVILASEPLDSCHSHWKPVEEGSFFSTNLITEACEHIEV